MVLTQAAAGQLGGSVGDHVQAGGKTPGDVGPAVAGASPLSDAVLAGGHSLAGGEEVAEVGGDGVLLAVPGVELTLLQVLTQRPALGQGGHRGHVQQVVVLHIH